jgi:uncharacterized secreted protein with C-terminal beta-propeller domain
MILTVILIFCLGIQAFASTDVTVYVDNEKVDFEVKPFIQNGRTLVPLRGVFEKLGAVVDWNKNILEVVISDENNEIAMLLGKDKVLVNGMIKDIDVPTQMISSRTFAPLRFISENLGHDVRWDGNTNSVYITKNSTPPVESNVLPTVGSKENLIALLEYSRQLYNYIGFRGTAAVEEAAGAGTAVTNAPDSKSTESPAAESSNTNNQVEGVEEGDIIKNDGKHIFINSQNSVKIIDSDPNNPSEVYEVSVPENTYIEEIYIAGDKLVIIGQNNYYHIMGGIQEKSMAVDYIMPPKTYEDRCDVLIYDISSVEKPVLEREYLFDGNYVSGRTVDDNLYLVSTKYLNVGYYDYSQKVEIPLPHYSDALTYENFEFGYNEIKYFPNNIESRYMYTVGIDLADKTSKPDVDVYLGGTDTIYVSKDSLYTALTDYSYDWTLKQTEIYNPRYSVSTAVYKFNLADGKVNPAHQTEVPGSIINQFSMDENNGMFRIATTTGQMWDNTSENNIYILDGELKVTGKLEGLAKGENIYSTRFMGNRIYMVTFKQVDPLFVIDASDPAKPKVVGTLKIPGYSTYLHPVDDNHILGFGYDTMTNEWGGVVNAGLKLTLFDVTDVSSPKELDKEVIGKAGTYSELLYNHKALMFSLEKGLMAFPLNRTTDNYKPDFIGAYVYNVSSDSFSLKLKISHMDLSKGYAYGDEVKRVIYIGNYLYSFSDNRMQIYSIDTNKKVNELVFK